MAVKKRASSTNKKTTRSLRLKRFATTDFGASRSYLFEYGLYLLLVGGLLLVSTQMIQAIVTGIDNDQPAYGLLDYGLSLQAIATMLVLLPLTVVVMQRTLAVELAHPAIKNIGWRKAFLGIFLCTITLTAIFSTIALVATFLEYVSSPDSSFSWQTHFAGLLVAALLVASAWIFGQDYRHTAINRYGLWMNRYRIGLLSLAGIATILFILFPFADIRNAAFEEPDQRACGAAMRTGSPRGLGSCDEMPRYDTPLELNNEQPIVQPYELY